MKIIFICTGNTCRSPMAEVLAKDAFKRYDIDIEVISRGISVYLPSGASENAVLAMKKYGLDLSMHLARPISVKDIDKSDLVLTMTEIHKNLLKKICGEDGKSLYTLKEFVGCGKGDIIDPFGQDLPIYLRCAMEIKTYADRLPEIFKQKYLNE